MTGFGCLLRLCGVACGRRWLACPVLGLLCSAPPPGRLRCWDAVPSGGEAWKHGPTPPPGIAMDPNPE